MMMTDDRWWCDVSGVGAGEEAGGVDHVQRPEGRVREEYEGRYVEYVHLGVTMMMIIIIMTTTIDGDK